MKDSLQCPRVFHWVAISNFLLRSLGRDALATHNHSTVLHDGAVGAISRIRVITRFWDEHTHTSERVPPSVD